MPLIDALKAVASQLVVLHHLASYGPLAIAGREMLPGSMGWLFEYARMAVQVFLVVGGFLAIRGLSPDGRALAVSPLPLLWKRYLRLSIPFLTAIALAIVASAIAGRWLDDEAIPARATLGQWLAHATLLHGVLGVESLSAGVWYVAIDFQLFALAALLLWAGRKRLLAPALIISTGLASLFWFNRDAGWDNWAVYFFGSYALGAAAWWAGDRRRLSVWLSVILTIGVAALVFDFRLRIALALAVALLLGFGRRHGWLNNFPEIALLPWLGRISYSVFLVHFPVLLLANAVVAQFAELSATGIVIALLLSWAASIAAGAVFYRLVESPAASQHIASAIGKLVAIPLPLVRKLPGAALLLGLLRRA